MGGYLRDPEGVKVKFLQKIFKKVSCGEANWGEQEAPQVGILAVA